MVAEYPTRPGSHPPAVPIANGLLTPARQLAVHRGGTVIMTSKASRSGFAIHLVRNAVAIMCSLLLVLGDLSVLARPLPLPMTQADQDASATIPPDQLDSLVAPIAL